MTDNNRRPFLELRGIEKHFGHVKALQGVDFDIAEAEVIALVGDNGAGKSTLIKVISGAHQPDAGEIRIDGQPVEFHNPRDALEAGIATVYQDLALVDQRDVASNIFLGRELTRGLVLDKKKMVEETGRVLNELRSDIPSVHTEVGMLSGGQRQAVAIARALNQRQGMRMIIMDEPVAALGIEETRKVLRLIARLKSQGFAIIVISHNLEHIFSVADRIVVLRRGRLVGIRQREEVTATEIVHLIVGAEFS
ncbi:MAG: ATP-binding cassette domain-containing protein [Chloroflexota bacterium]|nr:ATP-binding cassette domain-containing protein [Chloroflexota bacterium]